MCGLDKVFRYLTFAVFQCNGIGLVKKGKTDAAFCAGHYAFIGKFRRCNAKTPGSVNNNIVLKNYTAAGMVCSAVNTCLVNRKAAVLYRNAQIKQHNIQLMRRKIIKVAATR